jgi:hypothetical protein
MYDVLLCGIHSETPPVLVQETSYASFKLSSNGSQGSPSSKKLITLFLAVKPGMKAEGTLKPEANRRVTLGKGRVDSIVQI